MKKVIPHQRAQGFKGRTKGLIGKTNFEPLLIPGCWAVHTFGMKVPLDLVWLSANGQILKIDRSVPAGKIKACWPASQVLEMPASQALSLAIGDEIVLSEKPKTLLNDESGQALVEAAFALPVLLLVLFGTIQLGLAIHELQKLNYVANYATQVGALTNDDDRITGAVEEFYHPTEAETAVENFDFATGDTVLSTERRYQDVLTVEITRSFALRIPLFTVTTIDLEARASARVLCQNNVTPFTCS